MLRLCVGKGDHLRASGRFFCVAYRVYQGINVGEYLCFSLGVQHGHRIGRVVSEERFGAVRDLQDPAQVEKCSGTGIELSVFPGGDGTVRYLDAFI